MILGSPWAWVWKPAELWARPGGLARTGQLCLQRASSSRPGTRFRHFLVGALLLLKLEISKLEGSLLNIQLISQKKTPGVGWGDSAGPPPDHTPK